jgi:hypothetical protein
MYIVVDFDLTSSVRLSSFLLWITKILYWFYRLLSISLGVMLEASCYLSRVLRRDGHPGSILMEEKGT